MREGDGPALERRDAAVLRRLEVVANRAAEGEAQCVLARVFDCGGGQQHLPRRRGQFCNTPVDQCLHVGGHGQRLTRRRYAHVLQEPADLEREERVAAGGFVDAHEQRPRRK